MREYLVQLCHYNLWANQTLITFIPADKLIWEGEVKSSFRSIKSTVLHIWDAQDIWLSRLQDISLEDWPSNSLNTSNIHEIGDKIIQSSFNFYEYIDKQVPTFPTKIIQYKNLKGDNFSNTAQEIVMHCMNHSTFHRGQIVSMLRSMDVHSLQSTDMISYFRNLKEKKKEIYD